MFTRMGSKIKIPVKIPNVRKHQNIIFAMHKKMLGFQDVTKDILPQNERYRSGHANWFRTLQSDILPYKMSDARDNFTFDI